ncbi:MAG: hypothetical protein HKL82_04470 [Acidimicrobiaceae bacterium]|nr:hypothetical protein [Acidimicrobiaceae bacterium]
MHNATLGLIIGLLTSQVAILITTVYLHRGLSHKALTLNAKVAFIMRAILWITTGIRPRQWVAVHRKHHAYTDIEGDPHSPIIEGFKEIQFGNVYFYRKEATKPETIAKYAKDLPPDRWDKVLFDRALLGLAVGIAILFAIGGWEVALIGSVVHVISYLGLSAAVNAIGHTFGKRPYPNLATNNGWLAMITFGEGLHNNHHAAPTAAKLSFHAGEFDPAWLLIAALAKVGLANVRLKEPKFKSQTLT